MKLATAFVEVRPDTKAFKADLERQTTSDVAAVGRGLGQALAGGAFLAGAKRAIDAASDLNEAANVTKLAFGAAEDQVVDFAKTAAESIGQSEAAARAATAQFGGLLVNLGQTEDQAASTSIELVKLASDMASAFNTDPAEAVQALQSALIGEQEPIRRYNVLLSDMAVREEAVAMGLASSTAAVGENEKVQARLSLIMEQTSRIQGDFANTSTEAANAQRIAAAKGVEAAADLGQNIIPIYEKLVAVVGTVADIFGKLPEPVQTAVIALGAIAALTGPVKLAGEAIGLLATVARVQLKRGLDVAAGAVYDLSGNLGKAAIGAGALAAAVTLAAVVIERSGQRARDAAEAVDGYREAIEAAGDVTEGTADQVEQFLRDNPSVVSALNDMGLGADDLSAAMLGTDSQFAAFLETLTGGNTDPFNDDMNALATTLVLQRDAAGRAAAEWDEFTGATEGGGDAAAGATPKIEDSADALLIEEQAAKDAAAATDAFREAVEKYVTGPLDFEEAVDAQATALADLAAGIEERTQAVEAARTRLAEVQADPDATAADRAQAQQDLADAIDATSLSLLGNSEAALRNREELRELVEGTVDLIEAGRDEGLSLETLQLLRANEIESLRDQLTEMGYTREEIDRYIERIEAIPLTRTTVLDADTAKADIKIAAALARWQRLIDLNPLSVDVLVQEKFLRGTRSTGFAAGTAQVPDGVFTVGETGTETMVKRGESLEVIAGGPARSGMSMTNYFTIVAPDVDNAMSSASRRLRHLANESGNRA